MKKKIFLAYGYSQKNAGDLAITLGALDLLLSESENEVTVLSRYDEDSSEFKDSVSYYNYRYKGKVQVIPAPFVLDRSHGKFEMFKNHFGGMLILLGLGRASSVRRAIKASDLVIFNGGNLLRSSSVLDYIRLTALNFPLKLSKKYGIDYIIFPQSSAHINAMGSGIIGNMLRNAKTAFIREEFSFNKLQKKYSLSNLVQTIDLAFFIDKGSLPQYKVNDSKKIAFTFRAHTVGDIYEMSLEEKEKIFLSISRIIAEFEKRTQLIFVVQTRKDLDFSVQLKNRLQIEIGVVIEVFENYDPAELIDFYSSIDLLIGMRLHSIILAASVGTPCYGMFYEEWGLKNPGLMNKLQMPFTMMDDEDADQKIDVLEVTRLLDKKGDFTQYMKSTIAEEFGKFKKVLLK